MEQVENFEYLGTIINSKGKIDMEINHRINKANQIYYQINQTLIGKKEINNVTKMRIYNTVYLPTLLYGSESWKILSKHESRITSTEMKYLRKCIGKTRRDKIRNTLNQEPAIKRIETNALRWFGHINRMDESRKPKQIWEARVEGSRGRGRPRIDWDGYMEKIANKKGKTTREAKQLTKDRSKYRKWITIG